MGWDTRSRLMSASVCICLMAAVLTLSGVRASSASASPRRTTVTISASPVAAVDAPGTVIGRLADARGRKLRGKSLVLQASSDGKRWVRVAKRKTSANGRMTSSVKPVHGTWYRFVFSGTHAYKGATSAPKLVKAFAGLDTASIMRAFIAAGLPVANVQYLDSHSDPEGLLGTPNQPSATASWADTRCAQSGPDSHNDGSVDVHATMAALARTKIVVRTAQSMPFAYGYVFFTRNVFLHLNPSFTPEQADSYRSALATLDASMP